jgi:signal transduction histidine kinase/ActR/RegA family two-component response regulator
MDGRAVRRRLSVLVERRIPALVMVVMLVATVASSFTVAHITHTEERRLLNERSREIIGLVDTSAASTRLILTVVGTAAASDGVASASFNQNAATLTASGGSVGVAQRVGGGYRVIAGSGHGVQVGAVPAAILPTVVRALGAHDFVMSVVHVGRTDEAVVAVAVAAATPTVSYAIGPVQPNHPVATTANSPYHELNAAVYAAGTADPARLLLVSGSLPHGAKISTKFSFGADTWLLVVSAKQPLVGTAAAIFPWAILGGGLLLTVMLGWLVWLLSNRRSYAMSEVERHTRTLREAQEEAAAANRAKSEFISRMSHELRTPLNAVIGFGQILEMFEDLSEDQRSAVCNITAGGRHLLTLINEVLDISQVESGRLSISPEAVAVDEVVAETIGLLKPMADSRGVLMSGSLSTHCVESVFADRQRLTQVMLNLVGNAIKYNRAGGSVTIDCAPVGNGRLRINVIDTGPGITAAQRPLLFTPFERLGAERTTVEGSGMGLALSKRLTEAMGGTLGVQSTPGRGSTFWVELPLTEDPVERYHRLDTAPSGAEHEPARRTVLHVEDNLSNVRLVEQILSHRPDVQLLPAMQGSVALELARQHVPLLILLDLNLPDMSGEDLLARLRDDPRTARIPVVVISADATQRQVQRLLSAGATAYLTKPIDVADLLGHVDDAVARAGGLAGATL